MSPHPAQVLTLRHAILRGRLDLDYTTAAGWFQVVSEGQTVMFLSSIGSLGAQGGPPRQPDPVLRLALEHVGVEIVGKDAAPVAYRNWFARLEKPGATFDLLLLTPQGDPADAVRVHVGKARVFHDPDLTPVHAECWVRVAKVEDIPPYAPPAWDPSSGV